MSDTINLEDFPTEEWLDIFLKINEDNESPERKAVLAERDACKERNPLHFNHITEVLYAYDIMGLATHGAPSDEYDPEAATILVKYEETDFTANAEDLAEIIREEFEMWFGFSVDGDYVAMANEIITWGS